jgi:cytochrome bd ubiquinol oxidase subunit II
MWLNSLWFALFVLIIAGYIILDGFDLGVGILHPFVARNDRERRLSLNSVGPVWDGNEVWLVVGGGVLFAAFPPVYAALFSGFYVAFFLVLLALILRTVAVEFRSKRQEPAWRTTWDFIFFLTSLGLALLLGVAIGDIVTGVPLNSSGQIVIGSVLDLLHPFALWFGLTAVAMLTLHGALYLNLKTEGTVQARVRKAIPWVFGAMVVAATVLAVWVWASNDILVVDYRQEWWPFVFPVAAFVAFLVAAVMIFRGRGTAAFFSSAAMLALLLGSIASGLYPNLLVSTIKSADNMTVTNAASAPLTLTVMLIMAAIGLPFVLLYSAGAQYIFRGKVELTDHSY